MFGFKKRPYFTEAEAAGIKMQFEIVYGFNWRTKVRAEWANQGVLKRLWYRLRGQDMDSFFRELDRALAEDGYCGPGCVCYAPDGTPLKETAPVTATYSTIEDVQKAQVL